jgi:hypothetical protein
MLSRSWGMKIPLNRFSKANISAQRRMLLMGSERREKTLLIKKIIFPFDNIYNRVLIKS